MPTEKQNGQTHQDYRRVAIVGSWSQTMHLVPYKDPDLEVWGLAWRGDLERWDRAFDLHDLKFLTDKNLRKRRVPPDYPKHLREVLNCPVYLQEKHPDVPKSVAFPLKEVQGFFMHVDPNHTKPYFASTIAYMLALAIAEGVNEIHLYGVDLAEHSEWNYQKPNTEYYLGMARGRGIKVFIPEDSSLLRFTHTYGYEDFPEHRDVLLNEATRRHKHYTEMLKKLEIEKATYDGARQEAFETIKAIESQRKRDAEEGQSEVPDLSIASEGGAKKKKKAAPKKRSLAKPLDVKEEQPINVGGQNG